jgi:chorismate dehydratase
MGHLNANVPNASGRLRVGAVSYLNTKPLVYDLQQLAHNIQLSFDLPSCLADGLAKGSLDVALVPSIERLQHAEYQIVSNACIACRGPVLSVKLLSRVPLNQIRSLALDEGSRTSVALVQILLQRQFGVVPDCRPFPLGMPIEDVTADGILVIGDRAIHPPRDGFVEFWDLGEQWCKWTDLPFVFAAWIARPHVQLGDVSAALEAARDAGIANLHQIAEREASQVGMDVDACHAYLRDNLHFTLGPHEKRGLDLFFQHATDLGFAQSGCALSQR